jgi:hypothetical protein
VAVRVFVSSLSSFGAVHKIRIVSIKQLVYILYIVYLVRLCVCVRASKKLIFLYINIKPPTHIFTYS